MRKFYRTARLGMLLVILAGCIHKTGRPVTPWERVTTENALFAQTLDTVTQGIIAAQTSGLLTASQAAPVLNYLAQVAQIQKQLNQILALAPDAHNVTQIKALIAQIQAGSSALVNSGALGVKNPRSQQTIGADLTALTNAAGLILESYIAATGGGAK